MTLDFGSESSSHVKVCGLVNTCGALNTHYLLFHLRLKSKRPSLVCKFILLIYSNLFEPIKRGGGAIYNLSNFDSTNHGKLTAVILYYYAPYIDTSGSSITISFPLSLDITVNTIFGLPMLCDLDSVILPWFQLHAHMHPQPQFSHHSCCCTTFGLPLNFSFGPANTSWKYAASLCSLPPFTTSNLFLVLASPNPILATVTANTPLGFLQCTVHPTSWLL